MTTIIAYIIFLVSGMALSMLAFSCGYHRGELTERQVHNRIGAAFALSIVLLLATHHIVLRTGFYAIVFG